jgi:hypothetical protein
VPSRRVNGVTHVFVAESSSRSPSRARTRSEQTLATAFPDIHREIFGLYDTNDLVVVELSLNGTYKGPLVLPAGTLPPTGKEMRPPCCDAFHFQEWKIQTFNCYTAGTIMFMRARKSRSRAQAVSR